MARAGREGLRWVPASTAWKSAAVGYLGAGRGKGGDAVTLSSASAEVVESLMKAVGDGETRHRGPERGPGRGAAVGHHA